MTPPAPVPPDVLARAVAYLNANRHRGYMCWLIEKTTRGPSVEGGTLRDILTPIEAVAVAMYYGMPDPRAGGADR